MERDAILAHGASFFLKERLCDLSDAFKTVACSNCGNFATPKTIENKVICNNCTNEEGEDTFGQITVPYAFTLLRNLLAGLNIELKFDFKEKIYVVGDTPLEDVDDLEDFQEASDNVYLPGDEVDDQYGDYNQSGGEDDMDIEEQYDVRDAYDI